MKNCVAKVRKTLCLSQDELADKAAISRPHLSAIENNKVDPGGEIMIRIANVMGKKVEEIFFTCHVMHALHKRGRESENY
jgi:putative transcriptional regulator